MAQQIENPYVMRETCNAGDMGLIPGLGRSPVEGKGCAFQYCCLENPMNRGAWQATYSPWRLQRVGHS